MKLLLSIYTKMECAFTVGFWLVLVRGINPLLNWMRKNAVRMIYVRRTVKAHHEKKATRRKLFCFNFLKNQAQKRKALKKCEQHKREKMKGNQIKPIYNKNAFLVPITIFRKSQFGEWQDCDPVTVKYLWCWNCAVLLTCTVLSVNVVWSAWPQGGSINRNEDGHKPGTHRK